MDICLILGQLDLIKDNDYGMKDFTEIEKSTESKFILFIFIIIKI